MRDLESTSGLGFFLGGFYLRLTLQYLISGKDPKTAETAKDKATKFKHKEAPGHMPPTH